MTIQLPYGKIVVSLNEEEDQFIVETPSERSKIQNVSREITNALHHPLDSEPLSEILSEGDTIAIVVEYYTRPAPTSILLQPLLQYLSKIGVKNTDITIIIATGTHTPPTQEQIIKILGKEIVHDYYVISNDVNNSSYVYVGDSSFGNKINILKDYVESNIKILVGDIEYHYYAGYGGTRKSVLPGVASEDTIQTNHQMMFEDNARMGLYEENPISKEMNEAMNMVGCHHAISCVLNSQHEIVGIWAGKPESVMKQGVSLVDSMYKKMVCYNPDIMIIAADGHPHDINLYQALKALYTASQIVRKKGVIILVAACPEGMGHKLYTQWMENYATAKEMQNLLKKDFKLGAHKAYYHRDIIEQFHVILVSELHDDFVREKLGFIPAGNPDIALQQAYDLVGKGSRVLVAPRGSTTYFSCES